MSAAKLSRISDFCATGSGGTPSRDKYDRYYEGGTIPWVKSGELREGVILDTEEHITEIALKESNVREVPAGALLLAMYGATVGRLATLGVPATTNQAICHIIPNPKQGDVRYLFHALRSQVVSIVRQGVGGAQPNISQGIVKNLRVRLPPLQEQRRIAKILDKADALSAKRNGAIAHLDMLTQSIFLDLFGDPAANPRNWVSQPLHAIIREGDTVNYGVVQPGTEYKDGVPIVRVGDLGEGRVNLSGLKRIDPSIESAYKRSRLRGDEILVSCVGSVGLVALAEPSLRGFNIARAVARIPLKDSVDRVFVAHYLNTEFVQRYFTSELRIVSQPTLNIKQLSETRILLPPLDAQREFARRVRAINHLRSVQKRFESRLDDLLSSLQHFAFCAEL